MFTTTFKYTFAGLSDIGQVRDHNEDAWAAIADEGVFIIADGMGGHRAGEVAAQEAITQLTYIIKDLSKEQFATRSSIAAFFRDAFFAVNKHIYEKGKDPTFAGMGTTLSAVYLMRDEMLVIHVGDSRVYQFTQGKLVQLTTDHTLINELTSLGIIENKEAENFPYRHILTRAIGTNPMVEPNIQFCPLQVNDLLVLCTDGLTNYVSTLEIEKILSEKLDSAVLCQKLVELANSHGGGDNITILIVSVK